MSKNSVEKLTIYVVFKNNEEKRISNGTGKCLNIF